jgi:BirA family transcriptional regulator, biotin operon repressor / biotin---[acetyl-CoA-carboxylase] ligase
VLGEPRIHVPECASTQSLLDASMPEGAVATTGHQTAGRGRLDRAWDDAPGTALLLSVLLRPPAARPAPQLTLVAGIAVATVVEGALRRPAQLKWPNDVLVDGRKVSGGLAEARDGVVVLGIGLNVNQAVEQLPPSPRTPAASLRTVDGATRELEPLLQELLRTLDIAYRAWCDWGLAALHDRIAARDVLRGARITVDGVERLSAGIADDGRLELQDGSRVASGDVQWFP